MAKFHVGQMVKYVGREGYWSPLVGTIGQILKINYWGTNFLVEFPKGSIISLDSFPDNSYFWYEEDELEPINDQNTTKKIKVRCAKHGWSWIKV